MDNEGACVLEFPYYCSVKVHVLICQELIKFLKRLAPIFSAIESARPRCTSGIPALCSLQDWMDKAKSIIQHCSESSKLYLKMCVFIGVQAITGEKILMRCERLRDNLDSCLRQIQNMVPLLLAAKISGIIHDLRNANFLLDSADKEAGKAVLALIRKDITATRTENNKELEALQLAALKLGITSPLAVLIEKRTINRLLDNINDTASRKKKILKYLLFLLRKYGNMIWQCQGNSTQEAPRREFIDDCDSSEPPDEFKCPISMRLMYDPVIIDSGRTFERIWIERWFNDGNETCPVTHKKLDHLSLTPNSAMKSIIAKWCLKHEFTVSDPCLQSFPASLSRSRTSCSSSIPSFRSYMDDLHLQVSSVSICSSNTTCGSHLSENNENELKNGIVQINEESQNSAQSHDKTLGVLNFAELSWESQCKAVEDVKTQLEGRDQADLSANSYDYVDSLIKFTKDASKLSDVKAQREGAEALLAIFSKNRNEMLPFQEDGIYVLTSLLDSEITEKALEILEILSYEQHCMSKMLAAGVLPSISRVLETPIRQLHILALKILCNLSINSNIGYHMVYLDYVPNLVRFLGDSALARYSIEIMNNLCSIEEARIAVAENSDCIVAIGKLLECTDEQEHALDVLLSLCHGGADYCQLVMTESTVESLVHISMNGNSRVRSIAIELLQLLGHNTCGTASKSSTPNARLDLDTSWQSKGKKPSSKAVWFLGREASIFSKRR
ncbi:U-box domain-containing protein 5 [Morus notabilis]|uniref:RING-type E3 ubiquitin transferase n=1 Tax=Morus notabilis TaxID=981085 RepID=W9RQC7_9ROSA|nr:U-box domain-containing protein 5 [Morus notabilis]